MVARAMNYFREAPSNHAAVIPAPQMPGSRKRKSADIGSLTTGGLASLDSPKTMKEASLCSTSSTGEQLMAELDLLSVPTSLPLAEKKNPGSNGRAGSSRYNNVCKLGQKFRAQIYSHRRSRNLGFFDREEDAALAVARVNYYLKFSPSGGVQGHKKVESCSDVSSQSSYTSDSDSHSSTSTDDEREEIVTTKRRKIEPTRLKPLLSVLPCAAQPISRQQTSYQTPFQNPLLHWQVQSLATLLGCGFPPVTGYF